MPLLSPNITHWSPSNSFFVFNPPVDLSLRGDLTVLGDTTVHGFLFALGQAHIQDLKIYGNVLLQEGFIVSNHTYPTTMHNGLIKTDGYGLAVVELPFNLYPNYNVMLSYHNTNSIISPSYMILSANSFKVQADACKQINWTVIGQKQ